MSLFESVTVSVSVCIVSRLCLRFGAIRTKKEACVSEYLCVFIDLDSGQEPVEQ